MTFTTRPEIKGTFGVAASTHWIATAVGMKLLEQGGTAFDAAAGMGFVLNVVEPHLNGPLGDMPALIHIAGEDAPQVICGQGTAPAGATCAHYKNEGLSLIPGSGLLATVIPGAFDAWMLMLRDHGRLRLRDVLAPAIYYARQGHPLLPRVANTIAELAPFFEKEWPTSFDVWVPGGVPPKADDLFANPALADTWDRLLAEAESVSGRDAQIDRARQAFYSGFVAEAIDTWMETACVMDAEGEKRKGVLTGQDLATWQASYEAPLSVDYEGWTVWKCGTWSQGPTLLQSLRMLEGSGIGDMDLRGAAFVHAATEALKLSFADREAYYGDPDHSNIPTETLLSRAYADTRRALISKTASTDVPPGPIAGYDSWAKAATSRARKLIATGPSVGAGLSTMAQLTQRRGDTVHIDVIDAWGNAVSATPSGGWLQSSPVVPGLGMALNSRAQMFWLDDGLPTSLAPGRRPRTTLSPSMAQAPDGTRFAFGTPGGDQQDQWQLALFLRMVHGTNNLQEAIDAPLFHTGHLQASFYPRGLRPGHLMAEPGFGDSVLNTLRDMGHALEVSEPWAVGRLTATCRHPNGLLKAGATPRLMQAYAIGR